MRLFDYDARDECKKWDAKDERHKRILLTKVERCFSLAEIAFFNKGVPGKIVLTYIRSKRKLRTNREREPPRKRLIF